MNSGRQDFTMPCRQDFRTSVSTEVSHSVSTDVNQSVTFWKGEPSGPFHFDRFCSRSRLREREVRLFALAGEQAGTGRDIRPVFESRNIVCSGLGKLCFPLREIFPVTQNNLPARGLKTPPKSSFFTGHPCAETDFQANNGSSPFSLEIGSAELRFCTLPHTKTGQIQLLDSIQFFANKIPDLQFSFGSSERFLMIRLHKIRHYNTRFPAHQKEVSATYFRGSTAQFRPQLGSVERQRQPV